MNTESLAKFYADDHHRLDGLFAAFQDLKRKDPKRAKESFQAFRSGLEQHMAWEETILFQEYEDRVKNPEDTTTEELRSEHAQLQDQLDVIEERLKNDDFETARDEIRLLRVLSDHNRSEETGLYMKIDALLKGPERAEVFAKMKQSAW